MVNNVALAAPRRFPSDGAWVLPLEVLYRAGTALDTSAAVALACIAARRCGYQCWCYKKQRREYAYDCWDHNLISKIERELDLQADHVIGCRCWAFFGLIEQANSHV